MSHHENGSTAEKKLERRIKEREKKHKIKMKVSGKKVIDLKKVIAEKGGK